MTDTTTETDNIRKWIPFWRGMAIIVMLLSTFLFVAMLLTGDGTDFLFALTVMFWLPVLLIGLGVLICNIVRLCQKRNDNYHLVIVLWGVVNILLMAGVWLHDNYLRKQVEAEQLIEHYTGHEREIWDAAEYALAAMDSGTWMHLEFDGKDIEMFHTQTPDGNYQGCWRAYKGPALDPDTIGPYIGLTHDEIECIRQRLDKAGCISIELANYGSSKEVVYHGKTRPVEELNQITIGRKRHSMCMYFYVLYPQPMSDSVWNHMLQSDVIRIPVCDTMALEYGSPAFGSTDYPNRAATIERLGLKER